MAKRVEWGIAIPQVFSDGPVDIGLVRQWSARAEELGYESLWVQEGILGDVPVLEPLSLLSYVAAVTDKVRLGTSVMVAPLRNPVQLAKILGSLDHISAGRLIVGIGLGGRTEDYLPFGISSDKRVRRFVEIMEVLKALWTEPEAQYQGNFWQLEGTAMEPKPVQKPHPPIVIGARHPNALKRAVRHADGWMGAGASSTAQFIEGVGHLQMYLEEAGRDPTSFAISKRVYIAIDNDERRAETRLREWFGQRYKNADMASEVSVWGSISQCTDKLATIVEGGAEMLMLNPVFDHMEQLEALSQEVVPQF
jgi:probable F420-dependent oxidoreductase